MKFWRGFFVIVTSTHPTTPAHCLAEEDLHTSLLKMPTCEIICDIVSLCDAVAMVIEALFDLLKKPT